MNGVSDYFIYMKKTKILIFYKLRFNLGTNETYWEFLLVNILNFIKKYLNLYYNLSYCIIPFL